jgi:hypothetical protein
VLRTLAIGALTFALVPPAAVVLTRPPATKSIVLRMSMEPATDNPMMKAPASATR